MDTEDPNYTQVESNGVNNVSGNNETSCFPRSSLTAKDLLPADLDATNSKWANMNPSTGASIDDQNLFPHLMKDTFEAKLHEELFEKLSHGQLQ